MDTENRTDYDDGIQHGIDDDPTDDAAKGATIGGIGGAVVGAAAGAAVGPVGAIIGAVVGGVAGAAASGAAVAAIDNVDNDDNVSGIGDGAAPDIEDRLDDDDDLVTTGGARTYTPGTSYGATGTDLGTTGVGNTMGSTNVVPPATNYGTGSTVGSTVEGAVGGNQIPGVQTGGRNADGTPDTRGIMEKTADAVTGDRMDDKTGKRVD